MATTTDSPPAATSGLASAARILLPLLLLAGVIALFVYSKGAGLNVTAAAPIETVQFGRTILRPGHIELHLRNTSPQGITVSQVSINEAIWPFAISPGPTIPRLGSAVVTLDYPWVQAEAYEITLHSGNSIAFPTSIPVAATTAGVSARTSSANALGKR